MGASFSCVDPDVCNTIAPWTEANQAGEAWSASGDACESLVNDLDAIYCSYMSTDAQEDAPAFLPGDVICDIESLPTRTWYTCMDGVEGGYNCTAINILKESTVEEIATAWITNTTTDSVWLVAPGDDAWYLEASAALA